jgi:hypothetical protein
MKHLSVSVAGIGLALVLSSSALAAGLGSSFSSAAPGTVGPYISGYLYGNTTNPSVNGNGVTPSFAPGPWACTDEDDCAGPTTAGGSMGEFLAPVASGGKSSPDFANGKLIGQDFSAH